MKKYIKISIFSLFLTSFWLGVSSFEDKQMKNVNTKIYDVTGKEVDTFNHIPGIYFIIINGKAKKLILK